MQKHDFHDTWSNVTSRSGIPADELVSMLQIGIRRGLEKDALNAAYEMYRSSIQLEEKLWRRLIVISVEDIGFGDLTAAPLINAYAQMRLQYTYGDSDRAVFFVQAVRYLCRCTKERSSDCIKNILIADIESGKGFEVPDYAQDTHTRAGQAKGKNFIDFLEEGSMVTPQLDPDTYGYEEARQKQIEYVRNPPQGRAANPFVHFDWQT